MTNVRSIKLQRPSVTEGSPCFGRGGWRGNRRLASAYHSTVNSSDMLFMGGYAAPAIVRPPQNKDITLHSFYEGRSQYDAKVPEFSGKHGNDRAGTLHVPIAATYPLTASKKRRPRQRTISSLRPTVLFPFV